MSSDYAPVSGAARLADDTRRRFLAEIAARVPLDRLVEIHLFTPIRQGGVETGVAIVAARRVVPDVDAPAAESLGAESLGDEPNASRSDAVEAVEAVDAVEDVGGASATDVSDDTGGAPPASGSPPSPTIIESADAPALDAAACDPTDDAAGAAPSAMRDDASSGSDGDAVETDVPTVDAPNAVDAADAVEASDAAVQDADRPDADAPVDATAPASPLRHTVFTARYRYTVKGPERGKWDADVVEEADAPLVTVDAVVRGVQRRAGDAAEADRLDAETVARLLGGPSFLA